MMNDKTVQYNDEEGKLKKWLLKNIFQQTSSLCSMVQN